jgi:predicted phosphodiesterase
MKLLLISDLHANIDALNAVWAKESDSDVVLCVGDVVDWGFYPHETIAWLKERNAVVVYGNHDHEFLKQYDSGVREPVGEETTYMSHCINHTTEEDVAWLRALPEIAVVEYDGITYCLKHSIVLHERKSSIQQILGEYRSIPAFRELWMQLVGSDDQKEKRIVIGHSHICFMLRAYANEMYINLGSTHYRKGPDSVEKGADYITITDGIPVMKHVDYPTAHLREKIRKSNFPQNIQTPALVYAGSAVD